MKNWLIATAVSLLLLPNIGSANATSVKFYRDWYVEMPITAGVFNGLTLGMLMRRQYGDLPEPVGWDDPAAVPADTHRWLVSQQQHLWVIANGMGVIFLIAGVFGVVARLGRSRGTASRSSDKGEV